MALPPINYTWVGPRLADDTSADVRGPIAMARQLAVLGRRQQVNFFCLDNTVPAFTAAFQQANVDVRVVPIRQMLLPYANNGTPMQTDLMKWAASRVLSIVDTCAWIGATARDVVNVKNAMSYFLTWAVGGYVCDTGLMPDPANLGNLNMHGGGNAFTVPLFPDLGGIARHPWTVLFQDVAPAPCLPNFPTEGDFGWCQWLPNQGYCTTDEDLPYTMFDVWMFYSPSYFADDAKRAMCFFLSRFDLGVLPYRNPVGKANPDQPYGQRYYQASANTVMAGVQYMAGHDPVTGQCRDIDGNLAYWTVRTVTDPEGNRTDFIDALGVFKAYGNTHKPQNDRVVITTNLLYPPENVGDEAVASFRFLESMAYEGVMPVKPAPAPPPKKQQSDAAAIAKPHAHHGHLPHPHVPH